MALDPLSCLACPFDCLTCNTNGSCLSCSALDFRELKDSRCIPLPGHFETNSSKAGECIFGCANCSSQSDCFGCLAGFTNVSGKCFTNCPTGNAASFS